MQTIKFISGLLFSFLGLEQAANATNIFVIGNKSIKLQPADVRDVYLGDKQTDDGVKLIVFDNTKLQKDFLEKVLLMDAGKYSTIWTKKGFRDGLNPPGIKSSDAEVIAAVMSTAGGIGFVSTEPAGVKVIASITDAALDKKTCEPPKYPKSALMNESVGTVRMAFLISAEGKVLESTVEKSSDIKVLDNAALTSYSACKFNPGQKFGKPDKAWAYITHVWKLE